MYVQYMPYVYSPLCMQVWVNSLFFMCVCNVVYVRTYNILNIV